MLDGQIEREGRKKREERRRKETSLKLSFIAFTNFLLTRAHSFSCCFENGHSLGSKVYTTKGIQT